MKIGVIGTGYVGLVTGTCLSHLGHEIIAIDIDSNKIKKLNNLEVPIFEPGLKELMIPLVNTKLFFSTELSKLNDVDAVFIAVGTPSAGDGSADLKYVFGAIDNLCTVLKKDALVIMKSTVPVGTASKVKKILMDAMRADIMVVSNPEFLKEGAAIKDFLEPDRVVVGADNEVAFNILEQIYKPLKDHNPNKGYQFLKMSNISAEITKYAANCFLATKISFMNEMAQMCEAVDANVEDVKKGIGSDPRVGSLFLNPGPGYGGSCFPKDVKALLHSAKQVGVQLQVVQAAEDANQVSKSYAVIKLEKILENLQNKTIAIWGLAFKAGTDDIRDSSAIEVCKNLLNKKVKKLQVYDPEGMPNFMSLFEGNTNIVGSVDQWEALKDIDALVILTEWSHFKKADLIKLKSMIGNKPLLDMRNLFDSSHMQKQGFRYYSLGRN